MDALSKNGCTMATANATSNHLAAAERRAFRACLRDRTGLAALRAMPARCSVLQTTASRHATRAHA